MLEPCGWCLWTLRTTRPCVLWELHARDLASVQRLFPDLSRTALDYVKVGAR